MLVAQIRPGSVNGVPGTYEVSFIYMPYHARTKLYPNTQYLAYLVSLLAAYGHPTSERLRHRGRSFASLLGIRKDPTCALLANILCQGGLF